jgi:parallel beta-helix repeat protein
VNSPRAFSLAISLILCVVGLTAVALLAGNATHAQGTTRYVATTGTDSDGCTDPNSPCRTVQYAVDQAASDEVIKVAAGVYSDVNNRGGLAQVVYVDKTITIRGGYTAPGFAGPPDPAANLTILDAKGQGRVLYITGETSPRVEGLRISGGDATGLGGDGGWEVGGGVLIITATATVENNQIFGNTAALGGGLALWYSDASVSGNTFTHNTAFGGGGMYLYRSDGKVSGNSVTSNTGSWGGGVQVESSDATLSGNTISANIANRGGGLSLLKGHPTLSGNSVLRNAADEGGGLVLWTTDATLVNNIVADNNAGRAGSGLYVEVSSGRLLHNTISRNRGGDGSGVHVARPTGSAQQSTVALTNSIVVSHSVGIMVAAGNVATLESTLWNANTADWDGAGTINHSHDHSGNPAFVAPSAGDYHIGPASAALDRGVDAGVASDIDSQPRPYQAPDLGADEYWPASVLKRVYLPALLRDAP